jgi:hypothetical protein
MLRVFVISVEWEGSALSVVCELVDGKIVITPTSDQYKNSAQSVRENPVIDGRNGGELVPTTEPEKWLAALPYMYHGSRFYAYVDDSGATTRVLRDGALLGFIDLATGKLAAVDSELCEFVSGLEGERGADLVAALKELGCEVS